MGGARPLARRVPQERLEYAAVGGAGPATTFDHFEPAAKLVTSGLMILGRLEIYTALVIVTPGFWRR